VEAASDNLPDDVEVLKAALLSERQARHQAEAQASAAQVQVAQSWQASAQTPGKITVQNAPDRLSSRTTNAITPANAKQMMGN